MNPSGDTSNPSPVSSVPDAPERPAPETHPRACRRWVILGAALTCACLALRMIGLMALPIFGDESIYLRWAQVIRGEGVSSASRGLHLWVSLADPKPPLHFWLIALVFDWAADPLVAARLISVLAGVACVPLMLAIGEEFGHFMVQRENHISGRGLGVAAAILAILCPFLAFYQRLATADALFTTESLLIVWLSLRWARLTVAGTWRSGWLTALGLGLAVGAGLLTRQGVSYTICAVPVTAWLVNASRAMDARAAQPRGNGGKSVWSFWLRGWAQLCLAGVVAGALWTPYLTAELPKWAKASRHQVAGAPDAPVTNQELRAEITRRIMYKEEYTQAANGHLALMRRNAFVTFIPAWNAEGNPNSGWLPWYLTPLIFAMCLAGLAYAALRQRALFVILLVWALVLLVPVVLMAETLFSRYVLAGVPPLLFAGALLLGDTTVLLWKKRIFGRIGAVALWGILLVMPVREIGVQMFDWREQTLLWGGRGVRADRYQYLTGWTAGLGTRGTIAFLQKQARENPDKPLVIVTTNGWGTPADAVWVYLSREKNVQLYVTDSKTILRPGLERGTYRLKDDKWLYPPERNVKMAVDAPVYFVTNDPVHADVDVPAAAFYKDGNPNLPPPRTFYGIDGKEGEGVAVFEVPRQ